MVALRDRSHLVLFGLLATALVAAETLVVRIALPRSSAPGLVAAAVTFDLAVVLPLLFWWSCVRGRGGARQAVPVFLAGLAVAAAILPAGLDGIAVAVRWMAIPAEAVVLALVARKAVQALRDPAAPADVAERLRRAAREALPHRRVADAVAFEMALLWFAVAGWRSRPSASPSDFTCHRRAGYGGLLFALAVASLVEMTAVHLLVAGTSAAAAWALTGVSVYGLLWMLGDYQAVRLRPFHAAPDALRVRVGLRWSVEIPWRDVASVEPRGRRELPRRTPGYLRATVLGEPRLVIELRRPVTASGPYGITREVTRLGISVDDEARFLRAIAERTRVV